MQRGLYVSSPGCAALTRATELQANHSPAFWAEVEARFPAWRDERDYLREEGRRLKGTLHQLLRAQPA